MPKSERTRINSNTTMKVFFDISLKELEVEIGAD
jgi:hypothetical protein